METADWLAGDLSATLVVFIISCHRHPAPVPPKYSRLSCSPASTFPHSTQLLLGCRHSARLVSISPRRDYLQTFAHSKFHSPSTTSSSAAAVTSLGDSLSRAGKPPWVFRWNSRSTCQHSMQHSTQFAAPHSLSTPATSYARASSFLHSSDFLRQSVFISSLQRLLTPERLCFFTPATSYARRLFFFTPATSYARASSFLHSSDILRQSVFISSLQRLLTPERLCFFTPATSYARASLFLGSSLQSFSFSQFSHFKVFFIFAVLGGLDDAVTLLPLFFYATIS